MANSLFIPHRPPGSVATKQWSWVKEFRLTKIALILLSVAIYLPYVSAEGGRDFKHGKSDQGPLDGIARGPNVHYSSEFSREGAKGAINEGNQNVEHRKKLVNAEKAANNGSDNVADFKASPVDSAEDILSQNHRPHKNDVYLIMRERDELKAINEALKSLIKSDTEKTVALRKQIDELEATILQLREDALNHMDYRYRRKYGFKDNSGKGLLQLIQLRDLPHVAYVTYRTPLVLLRHYCKFYADFEDGLFRILTVDVTDIFDKIKLFYHDVIVQGIETIFGETYKALESSFSVRELFSDSLVVIQRDVEEHMNSKHGVESKLWNYECGSDWSVKNVACRLYWKSGHRHLVYWWFVLAKDRLKTFKGPYTMPKLLLAMYGNKLANLLNNIKIYVLWVVCFIAFFFLSEGKYADKVNVMETSVRGIYGPFVVSHSAIKEAFRALLDLGFRLLKAFDSRLELVYHHIRGVYPEFASVYPATFLERCFMLMTLLMLVIALLALIKCGIRAIVRAIEVSLFGGKRFKFGFNGWHKRENWYNRSFLRWSFNLLRPETSPPKSPSPNKIKKKTKYLYPFSSADEASTVSAKKCLEQNPKPVTCWQGVSLRSKVRDTTIVS
ncbi:hypothetical protein BgAZ_102310 [Babesia gibsoni]|uniref:Uncharacterized protein n=1 Tax=Babesia gibsoni TaxID=33632 RepID=A0AAD8URF2_BABGI|nr:hypothetical protein BgAZ_102310 [Babesia gibsoni]